MKVAIDNITHQHQWANRTQTLLLIALLLVISGFTGSLLLGELGLWLAMGSALFALLFEPMAAWRLTLQLYRARPIHPREAPVLWKMLQILAQRAELPSTPVLYYIPSSVINAFAIGNRKHSAIALTDGLLCQLSQRELAGVLGHEIAHIAHGDLKVMGLADFISRLTHLFSVAGQLLVLLWLPIIFIEDYPIEINPLAIFLLIFSPHLAVLMQLGLSRVREFDADLKSAVLTEDPMALAYALAKIEQRQRSWLSILLPGWGNPEPSWLRSHPSTEERIKRLQEYARTYRSDQMLGYDEIPLRYIVNAYNLAPRWRIGGFWR
jgi:heat shock protein HtpX